MTVFDPLVLSRSLLPVGSTHTTYIVCVSQLLTWWMDMSNVFYKKRRVSYCKNFEVCLGNYMKLLFTY